MKPSDTEARRMDAGGSTHLFEALYQFGEVISPSDGTPVR